MTVIVRVFMIVLVIGFEMMVMVVGDDDVHFCGGESAAHDLALFETGADVEGLGGLFEEREGDACIDESTEEHVAANAGEAFEITDTHRGLILNGEVHGV